MGVPAERGVANACGDKARLTSRSAAAGDEPPPYESRYPWRYERPADVTSDPAAQSASSPRTPSRSISRPSPRFTTWPRSMTR